MGRWEARRGADSVRAVTAKFAARLSRSFNKQRPVHVRYELDYQHVGSSYTLVVRQGEWWRSLTASFSHIALLHLAFNMMSTWAVREVGTRHVCCREGAMPHGACLTQAEEVLGTGQYVRTTFIFVVITPLIQLLLHHMLAHTRLGEQTTRVVRNFVYIQYSTCLGAPRRSASFYSFRRFFGVEGWRWVLWDCVWMDDTVGADGARRSNRRPFVRHARARALARTRTHARERTHACCRTQTKSSSALSLRAQFAGVGSLLLLAGMAPCRWRSPHSARS